MPWNLVCDPWVYIMALSKILGTLHIILHLAMKPRGRRINSLALNI